MKVSELQNLSQNNKALLDFINGIFTRELSEDYDLPDIYEDYGWEVNYEFDMQILVLNHDFRDDDYFPGNGWTPYFLEPTFNKFLNANLEKIRLDDGKLLFLINNEDYIYFQIFSEDNFVSYDDIEVYDEYVFPVFNCPEELLYKN